MANVSLVISESFSSSSRGLLEASLVYFVHVAPFSLQTGTEINRSMLYWRWKNTEPSTACPSILLIFMFLLLAAPHSGWVTKENAIKLCIGTYPHSATFVLGTLCCNIWLVTPLSWGGGGGEGEGKLLGAGTTEPSSTFPFGNVSSNTHRHKLLHSHLATENHCFLCFTFYPSNAMVPKFPQFTRT